MEKTKKTSPEFVVCINNDDYPASLELHKIYRVLPDEDAAVDSDIRIIDESGEDYLYPASYFTPIKVPAEVEESLLRASWFALRFDEHSVWEELRFPVNLPLPIIRDTPYNNFFQENGDKPLQDDPLFFDEPAVG